MDDFFEGQRVIWEGRTGTIERMFTALETSCGWCMVEFDDNGEILKILAHPEYLKEI